MSIIFFSRKSNRPIVVHVSVIIPSYNYAKYLKESLESVLAQDYTHFEIILVDDGSTDETAEIGKAYAASDARIHYIRNPHTLGIIRSVEIGMEVASGLYYHFFSSDDVYLPGFLSKSMAMLQQNPSLGLVCSDVHYFQDGTMSALTALLASKKAVYITTQELSSLCQKQGFRVAGTSCVVKKEYVMQYGGFESKLENLCDWYLFHKIAFSEGVGYIPEYLIAMRQHHQTLTHQVKRCKSRRRATYYHLLDMLLKDKRVKQQFLKAGLLDFIFRDLKWKLYCNPRYISYWRY